MQGHLAQVQVNQQHHASQNMDRQQHARQEQIKQAYLQSMMNQRQTRPRSMTQPSAAFMGTPAAMLAGRHPGLQQQPMFHQQTPFPAQYVRGPFGHSPDSTPSLSDDVSDIDDDEEPFQLPMSHSMPAGRHFGMYR